MGNSRIKKLTNAGNASTAAVNVLAHHKLNVLAVTAMDFISVALVLACLATLLAGNVQDLVLTVACNALRDL